MSHMVPPKVDKLSDSDVDDVIKKPCANVEPATKHKAEAVVKKAVAKKAVAKKAVAKNTDMQNSDVLPTETPTVKPACAKVMLKRPASELIPDQTSLDMPAAVAHGPDSTDNMHKYMVMMYQTPPTVAIRQCFGGKHQIASVTLTMHTCAHFRNICT